MAKQRKKFTKNLVDRWIKEGRGSGDGVNYKPWLTIQDVPSEGRCHRIPHWKHGRIQHLMSDLEQNILFAYSWCENVIEIKEQFPLLPHEDTINIAEEIGIKHPYDNESNFHYVLTTDFVLKIKHSSGEKYIARTVKPAEQLNNKRVLEKFEIERRFWESRNIDWGIVTEQDLSQPLISNIKLVYPYYRIDSLNIPSFELIKRISCELGRQVMNTDQPLRRITQSVDHQFSLVPGKAMNVVQFLIARRLWKIDMFSALDMSKQIKVLNQIPTSPDSIELILDGDEI